MLRSTLAASSAQARKQNIETTTANDNNLFINRLLISSEILPTAGNCCKLTRLVMFLAGLVLAYIVIAVLLAAVTGAKLQGSPQKKLEKLIRDTHKITQLQPANICHL